MTENKRTFVAKVEDDLFYDFWFEGDQKVKDYVEFYRRKYNQRTQKATLGFLVLETIKKDVEYQEYLKEKEKQYGI